MNFIQKMGIFNAYIALFSLENSTIRSSLLPKMMSIPDYFLRLDRANLLNFQMIRSKTGCYFALERLFRPQNEHCKSR